jgi:peptidoglycan/LPS O-acetylase OafA/YrhL
MPQSAGGHKGVHYRPDIDGLRAVAVLLVILFHIQTHLYGGFIGVDVFFVISGYLISAVVMSDFASGRFTIAGFYERRIRRILPALLVVMLATTALVWHFFVPGELVIYSRSQLAALFSVSNFFFWKQSGYFDDPSVFKPLLHTWSLGVEEQFYIIFPLLIIFVRRYFPQRMRAIICSLALISLIASAIVVHRDATAAFFFAPLRAWELLTGTIISQKYLPSINGKAARNAASAIGLLVILAAAHYYNNFTPFPGIAALAPCIGASLIIAAGETGSSVVGAILSWRPIVFLGLISYSLYLWHWPLLVFQRTNSMFFAKSDLTTRNKFIFVIIAIGISTLSWAFVEQPFRKGKFRPKRRALLYINGVAVAAVAVISIVMICGDGFPARFPPDARLAAAYTTYDRTAATRYGTCFLRKWQDFADYNPAFCLMQHPGKKSVLIVGDSHAAALYPGLLDVFPDRDVLQANVDSCRPFSTFAPDTPPTCRRMNMLVFHEFLPTHHVDLVVLQGKWEPRDVAPLGETVAYLKTLNVPTVVVGPSTEYDLSLPHLMAISFRDGHPEQIDQHRMHDPEDLDKQMATLAETEWHVPYVSIHRDLCKPNCAIYGISGAPLLFDTDHFTGDGAIFFLRTAVANKELP